LTVTNADGVSAACTIKHGAVATDDNGIINLPSTLSHVETLLGPMVRLGANPWDWYDDRHVAAAALAITNWAGVYAVYWDTPATGTVEVTLNSKNVVGTGTAFTTEVCQGPGSPTVPKTNMKFIVWYDAGGGLTGRRSHDVTSCTDDTHLTFVSTWRSTATAGAGYTFTATTAWTSWGYASAPANYYDNTAALYALYYRSGIDDYLTAARAFADRWWVAPQIDRGAACNYSIGSFDCWLFRQRATMGLVLRALDDPPVEMWTGLRKIWAFDIEYLAATAYNLTAPADFPLSQDHREMGYLLSELGYCSLFDTTYKANCQASLVASLARTWTPLRQADGMWYKMSDSSGSWAFTPARTAEVTNGSATVTSTGGAAAFATGFPGVVWFTSTSGLPPNNAAGDPVSYTAVRVSDTEITLDRTYEGTTGTKGWQSHAGTGVTAGWEAQPFMAGILGTGFDFAAQALAGYDDAKALIYRGYSDEIGTWIKDFGYRSTMKGVYYYVNNIGCTPPIDEGATLCTTGSGSISNTQKASREIAVEAARGAMQAYKATGTAALKTFVDTLYSAMWSKPGTSGPDPDGYYLEEMDDDGWNMTGDPVSHNHAKYFGMDFGFSALSSWPGLRLGGQAAADTRTVSVSFHLASVTNAASARLSVTAPNGTVTTYPCASSPCSISVDAERLGGSMKIEYLSAGSSVLASGSYFPLPTL
jgi:hypothetical protein